MNDLSTLNTKQLEEKREKLHEKIENLQLQINHINYLLKNQDSTKLLKTLSNYEKLSVRDLIILILEKNKYTPISKYRLFDEVKELKAKINPITFETVLSKLANSKTSNIYKLPNSTYVFKH